MSGTRRRQRDCYSAYAASASDGDDDDHHHQSVKKEDHGDGWDFDDQVADLKARLAAAEQGRAAALAAAAAAEKKLAALKAKLAALAADGVEDEEQPQQMNTAALDLTAPLAVVLLRRLSEEQIVADNWAAICSALPQDAVIIICKPQHLLEEADATVLKPHATLAVLDVKPSSGMSCAMWCRVVERFSYANKPMFSASTAAVRDALLAVRPLVTATYAFFSWCTTIANLVANSDSNKRMFGTADVRDAVVALRPLVTSAAACEVWARVICNLLAGDESNASVFGTADVRDALVAVAPQVTSAGACRCWCSSLSGVAYKNAANQQLLGTAEVRDALVAVRHFATSPVACEAWCGAIWNLLVGNEANENLFCVTDVRYAHTRLERVAKKSPQAMTMWNMLKPVFASVFPPIPVTGVFF